MAEIIALTLAIFLLRRRTRGHFIAAAPEVDDAGFWRDPTMWRGATPQPIAYISLRDPLDLSGMEIVMPTRQIGAEVLLENEFSKIEVHQ